MRVWLNGRVLPVDEARVSVLDHGLTVGDGVFETLKVVAGVPFAVSRHVRRLRRSAQALGLPEPDPELVMAAMADAIAANRTETGGVGRLRITYTSGQGPLGSDRGPGPVTLLAVVAPASPWPPTTSVVTVAWPRNERGPLAGVKSTSYAENSIALAHAKQLGASEAVLPNTRGELCEGTGSNVFVVRGDEVLTPPLDSGCLAGVTRALVIEGCGAREEALTMADFRAVDEVFLTSSTRDVHPVIRVDGRDVSSSSVGERYRRDFLSRAADEPDP